MGEPAFQSTPVSASLMDLPEGLLISILRHLPVHDKYHAQVVCRSFRDILSNPFPGSSIWGTIDLDHPMFDAASPAAMVKWLKQRAHGIQVVNYVLGPINDIVTVLSTPALQRKHQIVIDILPQLAASYSPQIHLDLRFALADALFGFPIGSQELSQAAHREQFMRCYWAKMAGSLVALKLRVAHILGNAAISALSQLSMLQCLRVHHPYAHLELSFPQLQMLQVLWKDRTRLLLHCPQLKSLHLDAAIPLDALQGIPPDLEGLSARDVTGGAAILQRVFQGQRLEQLKRFEVLIRWGDILNPVEAFEDAAVVETMKQAIKVGKLTELRTNCPLEKLTPLEGPQCALPNSLQVLLLYLPPEMGLPMVLEKLTGLRELTVFPNRKGPMHLDRSLDPFLDMPHLESLELCGERQPGHLSGWTPDGLKFLGMAEKRIASGALMPRGRAFAFKYTYYS